MIVITGASGFIGRHLFHELTALNTLVKGFSRTNKQFLLVKNYSDIIVDEPSILIHLAQTSAINSHIDIDFEIGEFRKLLEKKWEKIIYLSSASLYGVNKLCSHKVTSPLIIENDYQKVKAASEEMVNGLKGIIFRVTNVYGVNMNNKTIIKDIHSQLGRKSELILKNGYSVRDFIYIDDVVDCIRKSLSYSGHGVFNLGSGLSYSAYELASIILSITGNNQKIISADPGVNINYLSVDIKETVNFLRWEPRVDLFNGIKKIFLNNEK